MRKLKQLFCRHDYHLVGTHNKISEDLYICLKCDLFMARHRNLLLRRFFKDREELNKSEWILK